MTDVQQAMQAEQAKKAEEVKLVQDLIDGKVPIPNDIVGYLIEQLKDATQESRAVSRNLRQAEEILAASQRRLTELKGAMMKFSEGVVKNMDRGNGSDEKLVVPATVVPKIKKHS